VGEERLALGLLEAVLAEVLLLLALIHLRARWDRGRENRAGQGRRAEVVRQYGECPRTRAGEGLQRHPAHLDLFLSQLARLLGLEPGRRRGAELGDEVEVRADERCD